MLTYDVPKTMCKGGLMVFFVIPGNALVWKFLSLFLSGFYRIEFIYIIEYMCWKISAASCLSVHVAQTVLMSLKISWLTWSVIKALRHCALCRTFNVF